MFEIPTKVPIIVYVSKDPNIKETRYYNNMEKIMNDFFSGSVEYSLALHVFSKVGCEIFCVAGNKEIMYNLYKLGTTFNNNEIFSLYIPESLWNDTVRDYTLNNKNRFALTNVMVDNIKLNKK